MPVNIRDVAKTLDISIATVSRALAGHMAEVINYILPNEAEQCIYDKRVPSQKVDGFVLNRIRHNDWRVQYLSEHGAPFTTLEQGDAEFEHHQDMVNGNLTSDGGYQAVKHMRWIPDPPDALVCINDETAIGALHAVLELGWEVGEQVAVTGFDSVQAACHTDPPLTTLKIPFYEIARQLVRLLAAEITGQPQDHQNNDLTSATDREIDADREIATNRCHVFQPRLLVRASSQKQ